MEPTRQATSTPLLTLRVRAGLSREQLAVAAGVTSKTVFNIEHGKVVPNQATLRALAVALGVKVDELGEKAAA